MTIHNDFEEIQTVYGIKVNGTEKQISIDRLKPCFSANDLPIADSNSGNPIKKNVSFDLTKLQQYYSNNEVW